MKTIKNLILKRAKEKGIEIEINPCHKNDKDYIGSGRRNVIFPPNDYGKQKVYSYRGTLVDIGLQLYLISQEEIDELYLQSGKFIRCPKCNRICDRNGYFKLFGKCGNCNNL